MCQLFNWESKTNDEKLELIKLQYLNCCNCTLFTFITKEFVNLQKLHCYNCPLLTFIPKELVNLQYLDCYNCPLLYIPINIRQNLKYKQKSCLIGKKIISLIMKYRKKSVHRILDNYLSGHSLYEKRLCFMILKYY